MCHGSVLTWAGSLPADLFAGKSVCEVGSYDVNGTVRPIIAAHGPVSYLGVDISEGPGVDLVANVGDLPALYPDGFDTVITTEMLEHVEDWRAAMVALAELVKVGGHLVITTRSPGFPFHPYPIDCWRYPPPLMSLILTALGMDVITCIDDFEQAGVFAVAKRDGRRFIRPDALEDIEVPGVFG
jgi:SAM-dependent methyltransferase